MKITHMFCTALTINIAKKQASMNDKVIDYTVQFGYIGTVIKYDLTSIIYRAFVLVKGSCTKQKFKFYSTIRLWSKKSITGRMMSFQVTSTAMRQTSGLQKFGKKSKT
jgi:hypothetical protein